MAVYFASNTAFEMLSSSRQYAVATTDAQMAVCLATGAALFESWNGTSFDVYCALDTVVLCIVTAVIIRSGLFSRVTAILSFVAAARMIVPSSARRAGIYLSLASLVPWAIWLVLAGRRLLQIGRKHST